MSITKDLLNSLLLDQKLGQAPSSLQELTKFLREELKEIEKIEITPLAVKGQLKRVRRIFNAEIGFDFEKNVYYYKVPGYNIFKLPAGILSDIITSLKMNLILGSSFYDLNNIRYEHARSYGHPHTGNKYVPILAKAISEKKIVTIKVKTVGGKRAWQYDVTPYLLEQILGKWALIGRINNEVRIFLLEELQATPEITNKKADIPGLKEILAMPITKKND